MVTKSRTVRLLKVILERRRVFFRKREDLYYYAQIRRLIALSMHDWSLRDLIHEKTIVGSRHKDEEEWWWMRVNCVLIRFMPPSMSFKTSNATLLSNTFYQVHWKMYLDGYIPPCIVPDLEYIAWVGEKSGDDLMPIFGVEIGSLGMVDAGGGVKLPLVLIELAKAILRWDGCNQEYILGLPSDPIKMERLRFELERQEGRLEARCGDAHSAANLLKLWLRLLPGSILGSCQETILKGKDNEIDFESIDSLNRDTLRCIVALMQTITKPGVQCMTRMNARDCARVMAPNIFKFKSDDLRELKVETRIAEDFIVDLMQRIEN